ncbi:MAG: hypothetical protein ABH822_01160 [Patescibacteria group bacterium]
MINFKSRNFWWFIVVIAVLLGVVTIGRQAYVLTSNQTLLAEEAQEFDTKTLASINQWLDALLAVRNRHLPAISRSPALSNLFAAIQAVKNKDKIEKKHLLALFLAIDGLARDPNCAGWVQGAFGADFNLLIGFKDFIYQTILNNRLIIDSCEINKLAQGLVKVDDVGKPAGLGLVMQSVKDKYPVPGANPGETYISYVLTPSTLISSFPDYAWNFSAFQPFRAVEVINGGVIELGGIRFLLRPVLSRIDTMFDHYDANGRPQPGWTIEANSGPYAPGWIHKIGVGPLTLAGYRIDNTRKQGPVPVIGHAEGKLEAGQEVFGLVFDVNGGLSLARGSGPLGGFVIQGATAGTPYFSLTQAPGVIGTPLIVKEKINGKVNCVVAGIYLGEKIEVATGRRIHAVLLISNVITDWNNFWQKVNQANN